VGVTAFRVGKIAVNAKETFGSLKDEIGLWKVQLEYYRGYFDGLRDFIPPPLHKLATSRIKVFQAYIHRLLAKIDKAEGGNKTAKMWLIGKSSGEMGTTFATDIALMSADLDECIQFAQTHITFHRVEQLRAIDLQLKDLGQKGISVAEQQYRYNAHELVVLSRRMIFLLEWPLEKVGAGSKVPISWVIAGDIPYVKIEIQVSSMMQQAQDKNKKKFELIADKVLCDKTGAGQHTWDVHPGFVTVNGKHSNYFFRLSYTPSEDKSSSSQFTTKVKANSDSFKIYDPAKKEAKKAQSSAAQSTTPPSSQSSSTSTPSSSEKDKGLKGKASGFASGIKKKF